MGCAVHHRSVALSTVYKPAVAVMGAAFTGMWETDGGGPLAVRWACGEP